MKYKNTLRNTMYVKVEGKYIPVAPGQEIEVPSHISAPGLALVTPKKRPDLKKKTKKKVKLDGTSTNN